MKKVLIALILGSLLLFVQAYAVSAGTYVLTDTVKVECAGGLLHSHPAGGAAYNLTQTMTWTMDTTGCRNSASVTIDFTAPNPWSKTVPQTFNAAPGAPVTSPATVWPGGFAYTITTVGRIPADTTISASMASGIPPTPSLSTWGVLVLVLGLIAVSIALLRKRIRAGA